MLKIICHDRDSNKLEKEAKKAFDFVNAIFSTKLSDVKVNIYSNRLEFDKHLKMKTPDWLVANTSDNNEIDILSPLAMESESSHSKSEFLQILKHEFTHLFVESLAKGKAVPKWLNEGLAAYVAAQHRKIIKPIYIEDNFLQKIDTERKWNNNIRYGAYEISAMFVYFLIKKYSIEKLKQLLKLIDKNYYYPNFKKTFFKVYSINLNEVEKMFIEKINY